LLRLFERGFSADDDHAAFADGVAGAVGISVVADGGACEQPGFKERIDFGKVIGNYVDGSTGVSTPTTKGILAYSKTGIHVIPARP
jgi:putative RNase toxin 50 of polymorphic toxin system